MIKILVVLFEKLTRKPRPAQTPSVAWLSYCDKNPDALECRIYDV